MTNEGKLDLSVVNQRYRERVIKENAAKQTQSNSCFEVAALLSEFDLSQINALHATLFQKKLSEEEGQRLIRASSFFRYSQKYALQDSNRKEVLFLLDQKGTLISLFDRIPEQEDTVFRKLMGACLYRQSIDLLVLELPDLLLLERIAGWLADTSLKDTLPKTSQIKALISQERLLIDFKQQTKFFAGREEELAKLEEYVDPLWKKGNKNIHKDPLLIYGVGGIGKSTLVAKFITRFWHKEEANKIPFVYLDFDRITVKKTEGEPFNPLLLADEAFRQLCIQFPFSESGDDNPLQDIRSAIQYYLLDPSSVSEGPVTKSRGLTSASTRTNLYDFIDRRYVKPKHREQLRQLKQPILVVLDSFEDFQNVANSTEFYELLKFIDELKERIPQLVFVIVGRTDYFGTSFAYQPFEIGPFDLAASLAFLERKGIKEREQQLNIANKTEGTPLALSLLANLVLEKEKELAAQGIKQFDWKPFYEEIDREHLSQQLVIRNIEHISEEVRPLGIPGIIVRKITPEVIREVLAEPCGLGPVDQNKAGELMQLLKREVFLLEEFNDELYFRRDLRESIQGLIKKKYGNLVDQIHKKAIAFYEKKTTVSDRAEYLYHRLMRGGGVKVIDQYYTPELRPLIERSLWEFGEAERVYLYTRMGKILGDKELEKAPQKEWELYMISRIREVIINKGFSGLAEAVKLLEKRTKRTDYSPLSPWESKVYERLDQFDKVEVIYRKTLAEGRKMPLKTALSMAKKYELERDYANALDILLPFSTQLDTLDTFQDLVAWAFDFLRIAKRTNYDRKKISEALKRIEARYDAFSEALNPFLPEDSSSWEIRVKQNIPPAFAAVTIAQQAKTKIAFNNGVKFVKYLNNFYRNCLSGDHFLLLSEQIQSRFSLSKNEEAARKEIGLFLDNRFKLFLEEITEPGVLKLAVHDFSCFLEQIYERDLEGLLNELSTTRQIHIGKGDIVVGDKIKNGTVSENSIKTPPRKKSIFEKIKNWLKPTSSKKYTKPTFSPTSKSSTVMTDLEKNELKTLIGDAQIRTALDLMTKIADKTKNEQFLNEVLILSSRYEALQKDEMRGLISFDNSRLGYNQILVALLSIIDEY